VNLTKEYSGFTVGVWNMPYVQALNRKEGKEITEVPAASSFTFSCSL
jgi:hypothetical protein